MPRMAFGFANPNHAAAMICAVMPIRRGSCMSHVTHGRILVSHAQLVSSTTDGVTTKYAYDAAGRLVKEGNKIYRYGYLDKVLSVTDGAKTYTYGYHVDGQLARADYGKGGTRSVASASEDFLWDGLALIKRGDERFVNEPHVGGGNPVVSSKGTTYFNDMLGTAVGIWEGRAPARPKSSRKYTPAALTAFGETIENGSVRSTPTPSTYTSFYTGKPQVPGLGYAFLMRNYRASLGKWLTADPLGYPDGWNSLAHCNNGVTSAVDLWGCRSVGDIEYMSLDPDEYFSLLALGGKSKDLELEEFISEWLGIGRTHVELPGTRHSAVSGCVETTWAMFADYDKFATWSVYFVSVEFEYENFSSRLCEMAKIGGKISAAIAKVLSSIGIEAEIGAAVGTIIGSLEDHMKDKSVIGLGRYKVCTDIHEAMVRKYEEIVSVSFIKE